MKRDGLLSNSRRSLASFLLLISIGLLIPTPAQSATLGASPCMQTVDNISGVSVYQGGNSCYVAFKSVQSYIWTPPTGISKVDALVVAGGGGGGSRHAGGGGAGGLINLTNFSISSNSITITVGGGGSGGAAAGTGGNSGSNGSNSVISGTGITTQSAVGGGGGGYGGGTNSGGSGAGGGSSGAGGSATLGQGFNGSAGATDGSSYWVGGGGGGAGAQGGASSSTRGGNGGAGFEITWMNSTISTALGVGELSGGKYYIAGGGGGGTDRNGITAGNAGVGGGGAGGTGTGSTGNGATNSGGGGGGSGISGVGTGSLKGGDGGSGVVIFRYTVPTFTSASTASATENVSTSSNVATVTVSESSSITLNSINDYSFFQVVYSDSTTARIRFTSSPDFEAPLDGGGNNEYDLSVRATNAAGNFQDFSIKITVTDVIENPTVGRPTFSSSTTKGVAVTISIIVDTPGTVRFFIQGKKIPNCLARPTSGTYPNFTATCTWKPAITGNRVVTGKLTPQDGAIPTTTSAGSTTFISKRTNQR